MNEPGHDKVPADDPLSIAYEALNGDDPVTRSAKRRLWQLMWARDRVVTWISHFDNMPALFKSLHIALPKDPELLEDMKTVAENLGNVPSAFFIIGLVNQQLERYHSLGLQQSALTENRPSFPPSEIYKMGQSPGGDRQNYNGYVCAGVKWLSGGWLAGTPDFPCNTASLPPKSDLQLTVWMEPERPEGAWADDVLVETGVNEDLVNFSFEVDCATLYFPYGRKTLHFHRRRKSNEILFDFQTSGKRSKHSVYLHVFQGASFVKSLVIILKIEAPSHGSPPD